MLPPTCIRLACRNMLVKTVCTPVTGSASMRAGKNDSPCTSTAPVSSRANTTTLAAMMA